MYPFVILGIPHEASDEEVEARYQELLERYPPDRAPRVFPAIRQAYEQLRERRDRVWARLFYFDRTGGSTLESLPGPRRRRRVPLAPDRLAELLRTAPRKD